MKKVMFVCKHNSRRSQMAEGFTKILGKDNIAVTSAGLAVSQIDPFTVEVMSEIGIDISSQTSKPLENFHPEEYDAVISLCGCGVNLPEAWILRDIFEDWQLDDPQGKSIEAFRRVRDEIKERVVKLIALLN
ncbi:protein tyrosine phosphatase [Trichormus variabilis ATCC 29413]|uniref:Protein tyrosine phosphatase n=2 Tax=Anabaena variabilis TaxID=264691 RepID=Q3M6R9_TRIV2|nr:MULTISPECIES: arsenate reductase, glutathione/glutaredoxin type [Nostocaceae]ABA23317.1 protein tyrosine phosphatase [Trichormus variabilis ATCC 29413]MBC1217277.1 arsenate reductase, glutathione/glutaredoxin type [Trichormus variabilis ARAD]MBC1257257.1 arsenate reductase, glutathione/glutaredoxin type [Trichormus variabilis V5]MBC1269978.1 arsenate reductase, glutathione/glutaredoxin type [Trichormus variabilis FSR]MBC1302915.1 arsenate reductase, glutathione/glutaredoxin type [Trichormus